MFDQGPHVVLRRDGVCVVLKTPENEMPQVEYWGRDFGISGDETSLDPAGCDDAEGHAAASYADRDP